MLPSSAVLLDQKLMGSGEAPIMDGSSGMGFTFRSSCLPHLSSSPFGGEAAATPSPHIGEALDLPPVPKSSTKPCWAWREECIARPRPASAIDRGRQNISNSSERSTVNPKIARVGSSGIVSVGAMSLKKVKARRKVREPRFCFKTMSEADILDDGYKWRKYGQKVVKNTQHPRSYYRCTHDDCRVKKRVERLAEDPRMVITTYEGRHAHSPSSNNEDGVQAASYSQRQ